MFSDYSHLLLDNEPRLHYGVAVSDINGDGDFEFFICGYDGANTILKWKEGSYVRLSEPVLEDAERQAIGVAAGDLDGDGREEIYVLNTDSFAGRKVHGDRLFDYAGGWRDLFSFPENADALNLTSGRSVLALDRVGTGFYSFAVANYGGYIRLYELEASGFLADLAPYIGLARAANGRSLLAAPFYSRHLDLFAGNEGDVNFLFRNKQDGTFEEIGGQAGIDDAFQHARGAALVSPAQDGRLGIVLGNWEGPHRFFALSAAGIFQDIADDDLASPSRIRTVIVADFDNDGYEEIFFNNIGEPNRLFAYRFGEWEAYPIGDALEPFGLGTGAAVADLDGDGTLELLISHGESSAQPLTLYRVENANHWLRIAPKTAYGAPARGAKVTIVADGRTQTRVIDCGSGYLCQMEPIAHFGLGDLERVDTAEIVFPGGARVQLQNLAANSTHVVTAP